MEYDYLYKIILLGDNGSGKTSVMNRYLNDKPLSGIYEPTIGVDFRLKVNEMPDGKIIKLHLWDTAGQECFRSIIEGYYKGIAAAVIVFDLTKYPSFRNIEFWLSELRRNSLTNVRVPILLIGNKSDLTDQRQVSYYEAKTFAKDHRLIYFETSASSSDNIATAINTLIDATTKHYIDGGIESPGIRQGIRLVSADDEEGPCSRKSGLLDCCKPS